MRITQSAIAIAARHATFQQRSTQAALRIDVPPPAVPAGPPTTTKTPAPADAAQPPDRETLLIAMLVRLLSGRELQVARVELDTPADAGTATIPAPAATGSVEFHADTRVVESESLAVQATGTVVTGDGRRLRFELAVRSARREESTTRVDLQAGQRKDPLLIVLEGDTATLGARDTAFDIDADGSVERISLATGGSAFVALDRNGNGRIDDGSELFGARSGDGFAELAAYDEDGNGFVDAGDSVFTHLLGWRRDASGQQVLARLAAQGVGALWLGRASGSFELRDAGTTTPAGLVRSSGLYLAEDGRPGLLQQVDLIA